MPPYKRKRPHDDAATATIADSAVAAQAREPTTSAATNTATATTSTSTTTITRRVTRGNPQGLLDEEKHHLRSGRIRANTTTTTTATTLEKPLGERSSLDGGRGGLPSRRGGARGGRKRKDAQRFVVMVDHDDDEDEVEEEGEEHEDMEDNAVAAPAPAPAPAPVKQTRHSRYAPAPTSTKPPLQQSPSPPSPPALSSEEPVAPALTSTTSPISPPKFILPSHPASASTSSKQPHPTTKLAVVAQQQQQQPHQRGGSRQRHYPPPKTPRQQQKPLSAIPPSSAAAMAMAAAATPGALVTPKRAAPRSDRNIDKVVLGNICFKAWYPSYYGKEVLGDISGNAASSGSGSTAAAAAGNNIGPGAAAAAAAHKGVGAGAGGGRKKEPPMLDRLYVCPCCFKYSKELVSWWGHVRCCEKKAFVPGKKVYAHPTGSGAPGVRKLRAPAAVAVTENPSVAGKGKGKKKADASAPLPPPVVAGAGDAEDEEGEGEWSVWEVDGEDERLFCQNLSLFAKLFLDNKSVFFDVSGFNYFLLVYTPRADSTAPLAPSTQAAPVSSTQPPPPAASHTSASSSSATTTTTATTTAPPPPNNPPRARPQIVGFFSKEKMSWDNNNLACILVFPPWQRKGLGSLLMGVSYEISRRERVLGGPEKPISDLGRKGYKRFWAGEIARWLLELDLRAGAGTSAHHPGDGGEVDVDVDAVVEDDGVVDEAVSDEKAGHGGSGHAAAAATPTVVVDIQMCSRATWIVPEDCLAVLREMGVVEEAEPGPADHRPITEDADEDGEDEEEDEIPASSSSPATKEKDGTTTTTAATAGTTAAANAATTPAAAAPLVPRVRIDKAAVRRWVRDHGVDLERTCDPRGFIDGYGYPDGDGDGGGDRDGYSPGAGDGGREGEGEGDGGGKKRKRIRISGDAKGRRGVGRGKGAGMGKGMGKGKGVRMGTGKGRRADDGGEG